MDQMPITDRRDRNTRKLLKIHFYINSTVFPFWGTPKKF